MIENNSNLLVKKQEKDYQEQMVKLFEELNLEVVNREGFQYYKDIENHPDYKHIIKQYPSFDANFNYFGFNYVKDQNIEDKFLSYTWEDFISIFNQSLNDNKKELKEIITIYREKQHNLNNKIELTDFSIYINGLPFMAIEVKKPDNLAKERHHINKETYKKYPFTILLDYDNQLVIQSNLTGNKFQANYINFTQIINEENNGIEIDSIKDDLIYEEDEVINVANYFFKTILKSKENLYYLLNYLMIDLQNNNKIEYIFPNVVQFLTGFELKNKFQSKEDFDKNSYLLAPARVGKTFICKNFIKYLINEKQMFKKYVILTPQDKIREQFIENFEKKSIQRNMLSIFNKKNVDDFFKSNYNIAFYNYQNLTSSQILGSNEEILFVMDEAHIAYSEIDKDKDIKSQTKTLETIQTKYKKSKIFGLTASPSDQQTFKDCIISVSDEFCEKAQIKHEINNYYLNELNDLTIYSQANKNISNVNLDNKKKEIMVLNELGINKDRLESIFDLANEILKISHKGRFFIKVDSMQELENYLNIIDHDDFNLNNKFENVKINYSVSNNKIKQKWKNLKLYDDFTLNTEINICNILFIIEKYTLGYDDKNLYGVFNLSKMVDNRNLIYQMQNRAGSLNFEKLTFKEIPFQCKLNKEYKNLQSFSITNGEIMETTSIKIPFFIDLSLNNKNNFNTLINNTTCRKQYKRNLENSKLFDLNTYLILLEIIKKDYEIFDNIKIEDINFNIVKEKLNLIKEIEKTKIYSRRKVLEGEEYLNNDEVFLLSSINYFVEYKQKILNILEQIHLIEIEKLKKIIQDYPDLLSFSNNVGRELNKTKKIIAENNKKIGFKYKNTSQKSFAESLGLKIKEMKDNKVQDIINGKVNSDEYFANLIKDYIIDNKLDIHLWHNENYTNINKLEECFIYENLYKYLNDNNVLYNKRDYLYLGLVEISFEKNKINSFFKDIKIEEYIEFFNEVIADWYGHDDNWFNDLVHDYYKNKKDIHLKDLFNEYLYLDFYLEHNGIEKITHILNKSTYNFNLKNNFDVFKINLKRYWNNLLYPDNLDFRQYALLQILDQYIDFNNIEKLLNKNNIENYFQ